jgi:hypothetical protein
LHTIVVARLRDDSQTRAYAARRKRAEGKSPKEALRCLKRVVARQLFKLLERCDRAAVELSVLPEVLLVTVHCSQPDELDASRSPGPEGGHERRRYGPEA